MTVPVKEVITSNFGERGNCTSERIKYIAVTVPVKEVDNYNYSNCSERCEYYSNCGDGRQGYENQHKLTAFSRSFLTIY